MSSSGEKPPEAKVVSDEVAPSCFIPVRQDLPGAPASERVLDAHRTIRYDALLQLIAEVQRRRSLADVTQVVAARWKHCANVANWRLMCIYGQRCAVIVAQGSQVTVTELPLTSLSPYDQATWQKRLPQNFDGDALVAERPNLPPELAMAKGVALALLPIHQGTECIGLLSALGFDKPFDAMDRKFIALVASAMATRIFAILTEQTLSAELVDAERALIEQRHTSILGRLVNGVAHELNTPLGVQIAACDALGMMLSDREHVLSDMDDIVETVQLIDQQSRRAAGIVRRLKQISAASLSSPRQPTPLVEELRLIAGSQAGNTYALTINVIGSEDLELELDRGAFNAVLTELLDNARLHNQSEQEPHEDAAPLVINLEVRSSPQKVQIVVSDNGVGMPDTVANRLFEPFFTTKQSQGYIGMGGYIVQNMTRDTLGASVQVLSQEGVGTTVTLSFSTKTVPQSP